MPVHQKDELSLYYGLSGFWTTFFKDTAQLKAYYRGVELNSGQLYLELLETVLSTSLDHAPTFAKKYYHLFTVGEDELRYSEGASPADDRLVYTPANFNVASAPCLMNALVEPQFILESGREYDVVPTAIRFFDDPFTTQTGFPVRVVTKIFPAVHRDTLSRAWTGVRVGDTFRVRALSSTTAQTSTIVGIDGDKLVLDSAAPEYKAVYGSQSYKTTVLRKPFDFQKQSEQTFQHPTTVEPFGALPSIGGSKTIDFTAASNYQGAWAAATSYAAGDLALNPGGQMIRALYAHTSAGSYSGAEWSPLTDNYLYISQPGVPENEGLQQVAYNVGAVVTIDRPLNFVSSATAASATFVAYSPTMAKGLPRIELPHTFIEPGTLTVNARRDHVVTAGGQTYPAGQSVIEGVDYVVDYEAGVLYAKSGWDPLLWARCAYRWSYEVVSRVQTSRGEFATFFFYNVGDQVRNGSTLYACKEAHFAVSFDATKWQAVTDVFTFDVTREVRQMALWGADVLYDRDTLYENFGYLLAFRRPSSEAYRAFLRGVAQLFVLGPTLGRFESALNVMSGLPVIRDDGEILTGYDDGITFAGTAGQAIDSHDGRDGVLSSSGVFTSSSATFLASDTGAQLRVRVGALESVYIVTSVIDGTSVMVSPTPPDATNVTWTCQHVDLTRRFRTEEYAFTDADRDGEIEILTATAQANRGRFRIASIENASTVILDTPYPMRDEVGLTWRLSRSKKQTITTSRAVYELPYNVPVRDDVADPTNLNALTFSGFEALSKAFYVTDYVQDPTWWHGLAIPREVLSHQIESAGRRQASPALIEHVMSPLDGAGLGDLGLWVGADEAGNPGLIREGDATWFGGDTIVLADPEIAATHRDVGRYLLIDGVSYSITGVDAAGTTIRLGRFPPKKMRGTVPPQVLRVKLPDIIYRRTVGFVMMDKLLKYHALRIEVDASVPIGGSFLGEAVELLRQAKPSYTTVYMDTPLTFYERIIATDTVELDLGAPLTETIRAVDNRIYAGSSGLELDDAFRFERFTQSIAGTVGTYALSPTLPAAGAAPRTVRFHVVKGRFDLTATLSGRQVVEDLDYTLDRATGTLTVLTALPGPLDFNYWVVILRKRLVGDTLDDGETRISLGGANPITWANLPLVEGEAGLIDRSVQLILEP